MCAHATNSNLNLFQPQSDNSRPFASPHSRQRTDRLPPVHRFSSWLSQMGTSAQRVANVVALWAIHLKSHVSCLSRIVTSTLVRRSRGPYARCKFVFFLQGCHEWILQRGICVMCAQNPPPKELSFFSCGLSTMGTSAPRSRVWLMVGTLPNLTYCLFSSGLSQNGY